MWLRRELGACLGLGWTRVKRAKSKGTLYYHYYYNKRIVRMHHQFPEKWAAFLA